MNSKTLPFDQTATAQESVDYWRVFRDMPDPCVLFEAVPPYRVIEVNKAREAIMNSTREEVVGRPLFSIPPYASGRFVSTVAKDLREQLERVVRTGRSHRLEPISGNIIGANGIKRTAYLQATYIPLRNASDKVTYIL